MTSLERPLSLNLVVAGLILASGLGFAMGLTNALKDSKSNKLASTAPLAEVSGVPVRDAEPAPLYVPPPEKPKVKAVEVKTAEVEAPPTVIEAPPAVSDAAEKKTEKKPETAPAAPVRIEDLY